MLHLKHYVLLWYNAKCTLTQFLKSFWKSLQKCLNVAMSHTGNLTQGTQTDATGLSVTDAPIIHFAVNLHVKETCEISEIWN